MPDFSALSSPGPYHIISYGTLFGTQLFHSFIGGPLSFRALPRPQFAVLQSTIFPVYFGLQTLLPGLLALTYPGAPSLSTVINSSLRDGSVVAGSSSSAVVGLLEQGSRRELVSLVVVALCGLANWAVVGPATTRVMRERKGQEVRDGKKSYDQGPHSEEMVKLNKRFGVLHGISSLVNLGAVLVTGCYGFLLAERF